MDWNELAQRVEALDKPDRETDVVIGVAIGWSHPSAPCSLTHLHERLGASLAELTRDANSTQSILGQLPHYTASIDAAMSLVPANYAFGVGLGTNDADVEGWAWAGPDEGPYSFAKTPALALSAAALRARAAMKGQTNAQKL